MTGSAGTAMDVLGEVAKRSGEGSREGSVDLRLPQWMYGGFPCWGLLRSETHISQQGISLLSVNKEITRK